MTIGFSGCCHFGSASEPKFQRQMAANPLNASKSFVTFTPIAVSAPKPQFGNFGDTLNNMRNKVTAGFQQNTSPSVTPAPNARKFDTFA